MVDLKNLTSNIPLKELQDIQKAVQYFPMVPVVERTQFALRITNALRVLDECIYVSDKNCIFDYIKSDAYAEYVDWGYKHTRKVQFISVPDYSLRSNMISGLNDYIKSVYQNEVLTDTDGNIMFDRIFNRGDIMSLYRSDMYFNQVSEYQKKKNLKITLYIFNNVVLNYCNKMVLSFMADAMVSRIGDYNCINSMMLDFNEMVMRHDVVEETIDAIHRYANWRKYLPIEFKGIYALMLSKYDVSTLSPQYSDKLKEIESMIGHKFIPERVDVDRMVRLDDYLQLNPTTPYTSNLVATLENQRYIAEKELLENVDIDEETTTKYIYQQSQAIHMEEFQWVADTLKYIDTIELRKFKRILTNDDISFNVDVSKMYALRKSNILRNFIQNTTQNITFGCVKTTCYILGVNGNKVYMIPIFTGNENVLVRQIREMNKPLMVRVIEFNNDDARDLMSTAMMVIESSNKIEFDEDTNLKFKFKRTDRNTYMNRYSDIHNVLVQNSRNKNYEAMKTDLARMYALVYIIERDVTHSTKAVSPSIKADGTKARMFAKNDLKRYLEEVTANDRSFDLSKYFSESNIKDQIEKEYEVKINTLGVKKLLKTLV